MRLEASDEEYCQEYAGEYWAEIGLHCTEAIESGDVRRLAMLVFVMHQIQQNALEVLKERDMQLAAQIIVELQPKPDKAVA
jgi:hypothetical protein